MPLKDQSTHYYAVISSTIYQEANFLDYRFIVDKAAKELGFNVNRNSETPGETQTAFNRCMEYNAPLFILILGDILTENVKRECEDALRMGLYIMPFLKTTNGGMVSETTKKNMISISKQLYEQECCTFDNCEQLYDSVINRLRGYIAAGLQKKIVCLKSKEDIYPQTAKMICAANRLVILCQNTSSLLLGYRNDPIEEECYNVLLDWLNSSDERMTFIHVFSENKTKKAMSSTEYHAVMKAKDNLKKLFLKKNAQIYLRTTKELSPCVVADNNFLLSTHMGMNAHYFKISSQFIKTEDVNSIVNALKREGKPWISNESEDVISKIEDFYSRRM